MKIAHPDAAARLTYLDSSTTGFVGYDATLKTVIVSHKGTNTSEMCVSWRTMLTVLLTKYHISEPLLTDADDILSKLDSSLFPGISSSVKVHSRFAKE